MSAQDQAYNAVDAVQGITIAQVDAEAAEQMGERAAALPISIPIFLTASGLYDWRLSLAPLPFPQPIPLPFPEPIPQRPIPIPIPEPGPIPGPLPAMEEDPRAIGLVLREELRLDVDGMYPLRVASGTIYGHLSNRVHWIANLVPAGTDRWVGTIWYKDGNTTSFPYTGVDIRVTKSIFPNQRKCRVVFLGAPTLRVREFGYRSMYYNPVEFEYDAEQGTQAITSVQTHAHPNRPASLPNQNLAIETVFRRVGFNATRSPGGSVIPSSAAGPNARWSDMEMHDAMQTYWSRFANKPQWAMWVFFGKLHEMGTSLGGIMFDDIGPNHRQGTAIFNDSFISNPPAGDPAPAAWVQRMRFWTACHEMGHSFNLAHSWQKSLGTPWIPLANEPQARSFMNYPFVTAVGGQHNFFSTFEYRFSDSELLFMRHAPSRFVQMGNAKWFDHHGFEQALVSNTLRLTLRANRPGPAFEFLEPAMFELKLTNTSDEPVLIPDNLLAAVDHMTIVIKREGSEAALYHPYAHYCWRSERRVLEPGDSVYESIFLGAGSHGWQISEPGRYTVQVAIHVNDEDVVSNPYTFRVMPPHGYEEEHLAQDLFTDDVGRVLTFDGSRVLDGANATLRNLSDRLTDRRVSIHAKVALGNALARPYKILAVDREAPMAATAADAGARIIVEPPKPEEAREILGSALFEHQEEAAETLGHVDYKQYVDRFSAWLADEGDTAAAADAQQQLLDTLSTRHVLDRVLDEVRRQRDEYRSA